MLSSERKIVSDDPLKRAQDLLILLTSHREEMSDIFRLLDIDNYRLNLSLRKYLIIELFEFIKECKSLNSFINDKIVYQINKKYTQLGRDKPLNPISRSIKKLLGELENKTTPMRNKIAAHRYTDRSGNYISLRELQKLYSGLNISKLEDYFKRTDKCFLKLKEWMADIKNTNHIILLKGIIY